MSIKVIGTISKELLAEVIAADEESSTAEKQVLELKEKMMNEFNERFKKEVEPIINPPLARHQAVFDKIFAELNIEKTANCDDENAIDYVVNHETGEVGIEESEPLPFILPEKQKGALVGTISKELVEKEIQAQKEYNKAFEDLHTFIVGEAQKASKIGEEKLMPFKKAKDEVWYEIYAELGITNDGTAGYMLNKDTGEVFFDNLLALQSKLDKENGGTGIIGLVYPPVKEQEPEPDTHTCGCGSCGDTCCGSPIEKEGDNVG